MFFVLGFLNPPKHQFMDNFEERKQEHEALLRSIDNLQRATSYLIERTKANIKSGKSVLAKCNVDKSLYRNFNEAGPEENERATNTVE